MRVTEFSGRGDALRGGNGNRNGAARPGKPKLARAEYECATEQLARLILKDVGSPENSSTGAALQPQMARKAHQMAIYAV